MNRILIADDKEQALYYLQKLMAGHGYTVESARHGGKTASARDEPQTKIEPLSGTTPLTHKWGKTNEKQT
jgi:CheY-like chemotaxis protein